VPSPNSEAPTPSLRILLAEDHPVNQRYALHLLTKVGHRVTVVENGQEAIAALGREPIDLILMDVQMPIMDGLEATRWIRTQEAVGGRRMPIVALTAHAMVGDRQRCLDAGMDEYLSKPIKAADLHRVINTIASSAQSSCPSSPATMALETTADVFDRTAALAQMDGCQELLVEIVELFLNDLPGRLDEIQSAVDAADAPRLMRAAHALKGALGYLSANRARAAALHLEQLGHDGDIAAVAATWGVLKAEIQCLSLALQEQNNVATAKA
jgi:CheY-like chemotaxis protein